MKDSSVNIESVTLRNRAEVARASDAWFLNGDRDRHNRDGCREPSSGLRRAVPRIARRKFGGFDLISLSGNCSSAAQIRLRGVGELRDAIRVGRVPGESLVEARVSGLDDSSS